MNPQLHAQRPSVSLAVKIWLHTNFDARDSLKMTVIIIVLNAFFPYIMMMMRIP